MLENDNVTGFCTVRISGFKNFSDGFGVVSHHSNALQRLFGERNTASLGVSRLWHTEDNFLDTLCVLAFACMAHLVGRDSTNI